MRYSIHSNGFAKQFLTRDTRTSRQAHTSPQCAGLMLSQSNETLSALYYDFMGYLQDRVLKPYATHGDKNTRSDIYSLGVVLYELVVGSPPFDRRLLLEGGLPELGRIIRDVDPPRPSSRARSIGVPVADSNQPLIFANRRTGRKTLTRTLKRDLDWVVMRCLEKDRQRRYETANALADDLRRFLTDEPVAAGPPRQPDLGSRAAGILAFLVRAACPG